MSLHDTKRSWTPIPAGKTTYSVWGTIVKTCSKIKVGGIGLNQMFKGKVGDGKSTRFWLDPWVSNEPLKDVFPSLFKAVKDKRCLVVDGVEDGSNRFGGINGSIYRQVTAGGSNDLISLERLMEGVNLSDQGDRWLWNGRDHKEFSVKAVKDFLNSDRDFSNRHVFRWSKWVPKKCNIFMWRVGLDRIQTTTALMRRNCITPSTLCGLCDEEEETVDHLFCHCVVASQVWFRIGRWCKTTPLFMFTVKDLFDLHNSIGLDKKKQKVLSCSLHVGVFGEHVMIEGSPTVSSRGRRLFKM